MSEDSYLTLVIVSLSAVPMLFLKVDISELRLRDRLKEVLFVNVTVTFTALVLSVVLLEYLALPGIALAWMASQVVGSILARFVARRACPDAVKSARDGSV